MTIKDTANILKSFGSALIFCHQRPDGDTLSCAFALKKAYERSGVKADVVCSDPVPKKYADTGLFGETSLIARDGYDGYVAVDCASSDMLATNEKFFLTKPRTVVIDHHATNTRFGKNNYVDCVSACAINVYRIIEAMGVTVDADIADTLLLGILTDTGSFGHSNTDPQTLRAAADLIDRGADLVRLNRLLFKSQSRARSDLYLEVMSAMKFYHGDRFAIIYTSQKMLDERGLTRADTEGFVDYPLTIGSVEVCAAVSEAAGNGYKISLRSKNIDVAEIARLFGGGGHKNASGFMLFGFLEDVFDKLVFTIANYLD